MTEVKDPDARIRVRMLRLNAAILGISVGIISGLGIFVATNWLVLLGGQVVGPHLALLGEFLIGYRVSFAGSLIGLAYGLAGGFVIGYVVGLTYNRLADFRQRPARDEDSRARGRTDGSLS
jgi:hypothetical protein